MRKRGRRILASRAVLGLGASKTELEEASDGRLWDAAYQRLRDSYESWPATYRARIEAVAMASSMRPARVGSGGSPGSRLLREGDRLEAHLFDFLAKRFANAAIEERVVEPLQDVRNVGARLFERLAQNDGPSLLQEAHSSLQHELLGALHIDLDYIWYGDPLAEPVHRKLNHGLRVAFTPGGRRAADIRKEVCRATPVCNRQGADAVRVGDGGRHRFYAAAEQIGVFLSRFVEKPDEPRVCLEGIHF